MSENSSFPLVRHFKKPFVVLSLLAAMSALPTAGLAADSKIAVVDANRLMGALAEVRGLQERLEEERAKLTRQLKSMAEAVESQRDDLEKNRLNLSEIEVRRRDREMRRGQNEVQLMQRQLQEELEQREKEEILILRNELNSVVKNYLKSKKYDLVFYSEALAGYSPGIDITKEVIKAIKKSDKSPKKK